MSVKAFFSGIESDMHFQACMSAGAKHVLTSYLYLEKRGELDILKKRKAKYPHIQFMVDSGAHTFQKEAMGVYANWKRKDYEAYLDKYVAWLIDNRKYIFCAVELDIDFNVGTSVVEAWQKQYFLPLREKGIEIIYVWHKERGLQGWEEMCQRFPYVGLPGEMSSDPDFNKYMTVARRYCAKVHGFAATKQADFRDYPWYSVDSITWKTSEIYGTLIDWDDNTQSLSFIPDKKERVNFRNKFTANGFDAEAIIRDTNYKEVTRYALFSMRNMESFYERKYAGRLFYYDLRLPHPRVIERWKRESSILRYWTRFRPDQLFKSHAAQSTESARQYLIAISCVQNGLRDILKGKQVCLEFLNTYFPKYVTPLTEDWLSFQKELVSYTSPTNAATIPRLLATDYMSQSQPKKRENSDFSLEDLEVEPEQLPMMLKDLV